MPMAHTIYQILWKNLSAKEGFNKIEENLI